MKFQPEVSFELLNFMELIDEAMGIHLPDLYKRLSLMGNIDAIIADTADLIALHRLDLETVRDVLAQDLYAGLRCRGLQFANAWSRYELTQACTRVANTTIRAVTSPLDRLAPLIEGRPRPEV